MNERIEKLLETYLHKNFPQEHIVEYDDFDENLPEPVRNAKRIVEYMLAQEVWLDDSAELIGQQRFDRAQVPTNLFPRYGHAEFSKVCQKYYGKPQDNLYTFEWQHSNPNLGKVVRIGLRGYIDLINDARKKYLGESYHLSFLTGLEMFIQGVQQRCEQYRAFCVALSEKTNDPDRRKALRRMAANVERVPMNPASSFEEGVQTVYICWNFLSDSLGRLDQYLYPLYKQDIESGILTREHAKELLQELFIMVHRTTKLESANEDKGGESHFCVGGYTIDHEDGFNDLSELVVESMMEMPLVRPQVTLRWNKKTPFSVLKRMMDYERHDRFKRIAFANDEPRIASIQNILGYPWETAYDYIAVGCNEPAFQGGIALGSEPVNILRIMTDLFAERRTEVLECRDFEDFYALFTKSLCCVLEKILMYFNRFNVLRSGDCNIMSSLLLEGCIERAESATRGGASLARVGLNFMGGTNLIDSLCIVKQFVFEEKRISMDILADALEKNWDGYADLRAQIRRDGKFFGDNSDFSNGMAQRLNHTLYDFSRGRLEHFGNPLIYGNLTGYVPHFAMFGVLTGATPDGRLAGEPMTFGNSAVMGHDKEGVAAHLLAVAKMDPTGIMCGNTIMNLTMERETVDNEESFEKFAKLVEIYFQQGGLHLQLNYVSRDELLDAKKNPDKYTSLRVRVSGFSAYFTTLNAELQDNVIDRTSGKI